MIQHACVFFDRTRFVPAINGHVHVRVGLESISRHPSRLVNTMFACSAKPGIWVILMFLASKVDMTQREQTFVAIKPDGVQRGLVNEVVKRFEQRGYQLVAMKMLLVRICSSVRGRFAGYVFVQIWFFVLAVGRTFEEALRGTHGQEILPRSRRIHEIRSGGCYGEVF